MSMCREEERDFKYKELQKKYEALKESRRVIEGRLYHAERSRDLFHEYLTHAIMFGINGPPAFVECTKELVYFPWEQPKLRWHVQWFAGLMEKVLKANDHKCGWQDMTDKDLLRRIKQEVKELTDEVLPQSRVICRCRDIKSCACITEKRIINPINIVKECVDIANFCMMLADYIRRKIKHEDLQKFQRSTE